MARNTQKKRGRRTAVSNTLRSYPNETQKNILDVRFSEIYITHPKRPIVDTPNKNVVAYLMYWLAQKTHKSPRTIQE